VAAQGAELGGVAGAAARIVGLEGSTYPLVLLGGVLRSAGAELLVAEITKRVPGGEPAPSAHEPVAGALLMAFDAAGVAVNEQNFADTFPAIHVFAT
jgi:hypothetical protein